MTVALTGLATIDTRSFFERALIFGIEHSIISNDRLQAIIKEGATGVVQIAKYFGTESLRTELETARVRMVNLVSLYLEDYTEGDLRAAAISLNDRTLLAHSKGGSDLLRRLHKLPYDDFLGELQDVDERDFLDEKSLSNTTVLSQFRQEIRERHSFKLKIDLAVKLARHLGTQDIHQESVHAELVINSAMFAILIKKAKKSLLSRSEFLKLIDADRKKPFKFDEMAIAPIIAALPRELQSLCRSEMTRFVTDYKERVRGSELPLDELLSDPRHAFFYFANSYSQDEINQYESQVAKGWHKLTHGIPEDDVVATIFLFVGTGFKPKSEMLLREAKQVIAAYRSSGFDSGAVENFIDSNIPHESRDEFKEFLERLEHELQDGLSDDDPDRPDKSMARALRFIKGTCSVKWKLPDSY